MAHHTPRRLDHLFPRLLQLKLHVNFARSDKSMNPRPLGVLHSLPSRIDIPLITPHETTNHRHIPILIHRITNLLSNDFDGLEVVFGGGRKAGLDDVDTELGELAGDVELLFAGHVGAGGLLAVAEGGVEDADVAGVGDAVGDVVWASDGGAEDGGEWGWGFGVN
ncbi:unnamed protein product [Camellia sinensis]